MIDEVGNTHEVYTDHLGTPRAILDKRGQARWEWAFDRNAFGTRPPNEDPSGLRSPFEFNLRFPGQYYDAETGLHYNYFRDYEPGVGRYVQSDPIGLGGGIATYPYVDGNALGWADPEGLRSYRSFLAAYLREFTCRYFSAIGGCDDGKRLPQDPENRCKLMCYLYGQLGCQVAGLGAGAIAGPGSPGAYWGTSIVCNGGKTYVCYRVCGPEIDCPGGGGGAR